MTGHGEAVQILPELRGLAAADVAEEQHVLGGCWEKRVGFWVPPQFPRQTSPGLLGAARLLGVDEARVTVTQGFVELQTLQRLHQGLRGLERHTGQVYFQPPCPTPATTAK